MVDGSQERIKGRIHGRFNQERIFIGALVRTDLAYCVGVFAVGVDDFGGWVFGIVGSGAYCAGGAEWAWELAGR